MDMYKFGTLNDLLKYSYLIEDIQKTIEDGYDAMITGVLGIEKEYFNKLKQDKIGELNGISIVLVDGDVVEKTIDMDFVEGSNDLSDKYVPERTIWIDSNLDSDSFKYIILHEYIERTIIEKYNLNSDKSNDYEMAHELANHFEKRFRESIEDK